MFDGLMWGGLGSLDGEIQTSCRYAFIFQVWIV